MGKQKCKRSAKRNLEKDSTRDNGELDLANQKPDAGRVSKVFELDLLLEIIIHYAIRTNDGKKVCGTNVRHVRLVSKLWLSTVSNVLRRNCEPMFHLNLDNDNWKLLVEKFTQTFDPRETGCSFFLKLKAYEAVFDPASKIKCTLKPFVRHFAHCLVNLDLGVPLVASWKLTSHFQERLPALNKLTVWMTEYDDDEVPPETPLLAHRRAQLSKWLQFQLEENETLHELELYNLNESLPILLPQIGLLVSLTKLLLGGNFESNVLEVLAKSLLPNLTELDLFLAPCPPPISEGVSNMLQNFRKTLRVLHLDVAEDLEYPHHTVRHAVSFPLMEKLEELKSIQGSWQLESNLLNFEDHFPNLKRLDLFNQTEAIFAKWMSSMPAPKIETFGIEITTGTEQEFFSYIREIDIQRFHQTFPSLRSLTVELSVEPQNCEGFWCLFSSMEQLTDLCIVAKDNQENAETWDLILTGVPEDRYTETQIDVDLLDVDFDNQKHSPITGLTALRKLTFRGKGSRNFPLISDFVCQCVLLNMHKLEELCLGGRFRVSESSEDAWKNAGRKLTYEK